MLYRLMLAVILVACTPVPPIHTDIQRLKHPVETNTQRVSLTLPPLELVPFQWISTTNPNAYMCMDLENFNFLADDFNTLLDRERSRENHNDKTRTNR